MTKDTCSCEANGSSLFSGEGFSRRNFVRLAGTGLIASWFGRLAGSPLLFGASGVRPALRNTARNCILIFLAGGPSQSDTFDLKEGAWTPRDIEPTSYGDLRWPRGLFPRLSAHLDKLAIIRTARAWAALHPLAQRWSQISRDPALPSAAFAPHIGAVVALEGERSRTAADVLPPFIAFGPTAAAAGYLPGRTAPARFAAQAREEAYDLSPDGLRDRSHPDGSDRLGRRWKMLEALDASRLAADLGKQAADMASFYTEAKQLAETPGIDSVFGASPEAETRYGQTPLGNALLLARNLFAANRGTRFIQVTQPGWDHHSSIYNVASGESLYGVGGNLDEALGALLSDLSVTPGAAEGKTLLDETLVVILGEFGRTVGPLTSALGRDHLLRMSVAFAGGGVKGGRVVGATNDDGRVRDYGWSGARDIRPEDLTATIYSALGIDYTTVRTDDPSSQGFEYVPQASEGRFFPVDELFV